MFPPVASLQADLRTALRWLACALLCSLMVAGTAGSALAAEQALVIDHATVVNVNDGSLLRNMAVVITGDRISAVTASAKAKPLKGAQVVDGSGKFVIPGPWDMHVHTIFGDWLPKDEKIMDPTVLVQTHSSTRETRF